MSDGIEETRDYDTHDNSIDATLDISIEDIQYISRVLTDALINRQQGVESENDGIRRHDHQQSPQQDRSIYEYYRVFYITEEEISKQVDLDLLASAVHGIVDPLGQLAAFITSVINAAVSSINTFISNAVSGIRTLISTISTTVESAINTVRNAILSSLSSAVNTLSSLISSAISTLSSLISSITSTISSLISSAVSTLSSLISSAVSSISSALSRAVSQITSTISSIVSQITSTISSLISSAVSTLSSLLSSAISTLSSLISSAISTLSSLLSSAVNTLSSLISSAVSNLSSLISSAIQTIVSTVTSLASTITNVISSAISSVISTLSSLISSAISSLVNAISSFASTIITSITNIFQQIWNVLSQIGNIIWNALVQFGNVIYNILQTIWNQIVGFFQPIFNQLYQSITTFMTEFIPNALRGLKEFIHELWSAVVNGLGYAGAQIVSLFNYVVSAFADMAQKVGAGFGQITLTLTGFSNAVMNAGSLIRAGLNDIISALQSIGNFLKPLFDFGAWFKEHFLDKVAEWFDEYIIRGNALRVIINAGQIILRGFTSMITSMGKALWDMLSTLGGSFINIISLGVRGLLDFGQTVASKVSGIFLTPVMDMIKSVFTGLSTHVKDMVPRIAAGQTQGEILEAMGLFGLLVSTQFTFRMVAQALLWLGEMTADWSLAPAVTLSFLVGSKTVQVSIPLKFGNVVKHMASEFKSYSDELMRGFFYGLAIWVTQPIVRSINSIFRNSIPIELPGIDILREFIRRSMPHARFKQVLEKARYFMSLQGYSDYVINLFMESGDTYNLTISDRFNAKRIIPLSMIYALPEATDIARMAIRDVFGMGREGIDTFLKVYHARGMHPDIGILFYLLHYKYPPPERLWQFITRGISGVLWARITPDILDAIRGEAERLNAPLPTSAVEWNFRARELLAALQIYMTWQDHARFTWIGKDLLGWDKNFTSDNQIMIDTLADIPTKIDQRWMLRWGLYEHLSTRGVNVNSPIRDFAVKILDDRPVTEIKLDIQNFARTIQATGLHPDWVPVVAVAETMNALTEERTLLRTGFINLFKEGFYDIPALEKLLSGFVKAAFNVSYFDMETMQWRTGWVNLPVMFLPPERRLLQLRALMDRSLDILREIQRDISTGYQEFIIESYDEYKKRLSAVIDNINKFYASDYKAITGVDLPPELKLKFVEDYYRPYIDALGIWRDVFTIRRARAWAMRWIGWVFYRVAIGAVTANDVAELLHFISTKAKLTNYETEFIQQILEKMYAMAASEYMPTPSTMATLSEYITLDKELLRKTLIERRVPEPWLSLWLRYIEVRPIKADARALLSAHIRAFRLGVIPKEMVQAFINELGAYGFTPKEVEFITRTMDLEESILEYRTNRQEYIPSPLTLASIAEYLPEARHFYDDVVKAKRIPPTWQEFWAKYIDIRPMVDDIKKYLARAETLYARFMVRREEFIRVLQEVRSYLGFTDNEERFLLKTIDLERIKTIWMELMGTVEKLVALSEYSPKAAEYAIARVEAMIDALPIPAPDRAELKAMWTEYIKNRPVKAEAKTYITQLINLYVDGLITEQAFKRELREMQQWGFSDNELMFYEAQAALRKLRKMRIPVGE